PANIIQENTTNQNVSQLEIQPYINTTKITEQNNVSLSVQQNSSIIKSTQSNSTLQPIIQNDPIWNDIIIGLSITAAAIMIGVGIFVKTYRNKGNAKKDL
ncbi:MAG: hypothetical protein ACREAT_05500, partial [Nitrosotalea sp.]